MPVCRRKFALPCLVALAMTLPASAARPAAAALVLTWGNNQDGQLGDGTTANHLTPEVVGPADGSVSAAAAGFVHSLALRNGGLLGWGADFDGQLGDGGQTANVLTPRPTAGLLSSGVTLVVGGANYSLGLVNGSVYGWGVNAGGDLGNGTSKDSTTPVATLGLPAGVTALAAGGQHSLAVAAGGLYAWGDNMNGDVGIGTTKKQTTPVVVPGLGSGVTAVAAGDSHSVAVVNGAVYAWGNNLSGELGIGTTTNQKSPVAVGGPVASGVTAVAAGFNHTLAVVNGHVYAWGENSGGALGDGTYTNALTPELIDPTDLTNIVAVAAGTGASYALSADGSLWVWGIDQSGELGLGDLVNRNTPQHLLPPPGYAFTSVTAEEFGETVVATATSVPEPAAAATAATLVAGLLARRRRLSTTARPALR